MPGETADTVDTTGIIGQISETAQLPVQPSALPYLLQALGDPDIDAHKLAGIIERFPSIAVRLIALVNSAWYAPIDPITSVERACAHLGFNLVRAVSMSLAVMAPFNPSRCTEFESETYWCTTFLVAESAATLTSCAKKVEGLSPDTARAAGLFHNLGLLWLADTMPLETAMAMVAAHGAGLGLNNALRECCRTDACEVGGLLGRAWRLPDDLVAAMEHRNNPEYQGRGWEVAALVQSATGIVDAVIRGDMEPATDRGLERLEINRSDRDSVLTEVAAKLDQTMDMTRTLKL